MLLSMIATLGAMSELPDFETMYLEFQPRADGTTPGTNEVLDALRERHIAGVAIQGARFGVDTPVIAKIAMSMQDDTAMVLHTLPTGELEFGEFAGSSCAELATALNTNVVADEYVLYRPGSVGGEPEFTELDPRRQSIDQPAGFPNEWRVSPPHLRSKAAVFADGHDPAIPHSIAQDTDQVVTYGTLHGNQFIEMPDGVVELPARLPSSSKQRIVLFAQAGEAKFAHLVIGKHKNPLHLTFANLPRFTPVSEFPENSAASHLLTLLSNAGLVTGNINMSHPQFPHHVMPRYQYLCDPVNSHSFFGELAEILSLPQQFSRLAESGFPSIHAGSPDSTEFESVNQSTPTDVPVAKRAWFKRP